MSKDLVVTDDNLMEVVERYERMKEQRLADQRALDTMYQEELFLKDKMISFISQTGRLRQLGDGRAAAITEAREPFITNFNLLAEFIIKEGAIDLLQKRLTPTAVKARWGDGIDIPGVAETVKYDLKFI